MQSDHLFPVRSILEFKSFANIESGLQHCHSDMCAGCTSYREPMKRRKRHNKIQGPTQSSCRVQARLLKELAAECKLDPMPNAATVVVECKLGPTAQFRYQTCESRTINELLVDYLGTKGRSLN